MNSNIVECEEAERDPGMCVCKNGPTLSILKEVHKLYEEKLELIDKVGGSSKLQLQSDVLRSWVSDLIGQNTLLVRAVEELESEATKLITERKKYNEVVSKLHVEVGALRRRLARKDSDLRGLIEVLRRLREFDYCTLDGIHFFEVTESDIFGSIEYAFKFVAKCLAAAARLQRCSHALDDFTMDSNEETLLYLYKKIRARVPSRSADSKNTCNRLCELKMMSDLLKKENVAKDREIRQLHKEIQQYEQTILNLRNDTSHGKYTTDVSRKDAEVMAGMCCTGSECGEWEPVKDFTEMLRAETQHFQERIQQMESNLKSSGESVRALRKLNVSLTEEMHAMRRVCAALVEEGQAATVRAQFKDDIIREMRRQLKQAKAKLRETTGALGIQKDSVRGDGECPRGSSVSYDSVTIACVRAQPRRKRDEQVEPVYHNIHESVACDNLLRGNLEQDGLISSNIIFGNQFCDNPTGEPSYSECGRNLNDSRDEELANGA